jgi:hypothetical protein
MLLVVDWLYRRKPEGSTARSGFSANSKALAYLVAAEVPASVADFIWRRGDLSGHDRLGHSVTNWGLLQMTATFVYCIAFHAIGGWPRRRDTSGDPPSV